MIHVWPVIHQCLHLNQQLNEDAQRAKSQLILQKREANRKLHFQRLKCRLTSRSWRHEADASSLDFSRGSAELWKCTKMKRGEKKKTCRLWWCVCFFLLTVNNRSNVATACRADKNYRKQHSWTSKCDTNTERRRRTRREGEQGTEREREEKTDR